MAETPTKTGRNRPPFAIAQARRVLEDAQQRLKDLQSQKVQGPSLEEAQQAVKDAQKQLDKLTSGSQQDRRDERRDYMNDYYNELGGPWVAELVKRDPELRKLFEQAISNGWQTDRFINEVYQTKWWNDPQRSASWKTAFQQEYAKDKTGWNQSIADAERTIADMADKLYNMKIPDDMLKTLARRYLYQGWNQYDNRGLRSWLATTFQSGGPTPTTPDTGDGSGTGTNTGLQPGGMFVDTEQALRDLTRGYGLIRTPDWFSNTASKLLDPNSGLSQDDVVNSLIQEAEGLYPALAGRLSKDVSVRDAASGYIAQLSRMLEIQNADSIDLTDPLLQKALTNLNDKNEGSLMPLWQFQQEIRKDDRWQLTDNARQTYMGAGTAFLRALGFVG